MKKRIIAIVLSAVMIAGCIPVFAANGGYASGITAEMESAEFWVENTEQDAGILLMTSEEIDEMNELIIKTSGTNVYDMERIKEPFDAIALSKSLSANEIPTRDIYINGILIDNKAYYESLNMAVLSTGYGSSSEYCRYAIAVRNADVKSLPTSDKICYSLTDTSDEIQTSMLLVGEPFIIKQRCEFNGELFYWGYTCNCTGWVNASDLAICKDKEEWLSVWKTSAADKDVLVVTDDSFSLEQNLFAPRTSGLVLKQGTVLKLVPDEDIPASVSRRGTWHNYVVYVPSRDENGGFEYEVSLVSVNNGVSVGFVPMTAENILKLAFNSLGDRYGWGNMLGASDCSGFLRNIYRCFGLSIPRNTTWQQTVKSTVVDLSYMTDDEKLQCLASMPAGTLLYFPGHAMMYTGIKDGIPYVISNTGILSDSEGELNVIDMYSVILNPLTVRRANASTWLRNIASAVIWAPQSRAKVFIPEHYLLDDVKKSDYFYDSVEWALKKGITKGADINHFVPSRIITAYEIITFIERALGIEIEEEYDSSAAMTRGQVIELIEKYTEKTVPYDESQSLDGECTRAMAITFLYRVLK